MGQSEYKRVLTKQITKVTKNDFIFQSIVGKGGFGKVWKVIVPKLNNAQFAMKELSKLKIYDTNNIKNITQEKEILSKLHNDFIANMYATFQDNDHLYILLDYLEGGDLRYQLYKKKSFNEEQTKFFVACVIEGLSYIHSKHIIHHDIKPENLVLDKNGYVHITDFGVAKNNLVSIQGERSGTLGYMAPEILNKSYHSYSSDLFSVGVVCFEFVFGYRPFQAQSTNDYIEQINSRPIIIKKFQLPNTYYDEEICNFINGLLVSNCEKRLGRKSVIELKAHPWFNNFKWEKLKDKTMNSPFNISSFNNFDKNLCEYSELIGNTTRERYEAYLKEEDYKLAFDNFTFIYNENPIQFIKKNKTEIKKREKKLLFRSPTHSTVFNITGFHHKPSRHSSHSTYCKLPLLTTQHKFINGMAPTLITKNCNVTSRIQRHSKLVKCVSFRSPSFPNNINQTSLLKVFITKVATYQKSIKFSSMITMKRESKSLV